MSEAFDFKEQAKALLKRLGSNPNAPMQAQLAQAAIEAALREAYLSGQQDAKARPGASRALGNALPAAPAKPASKAKAPAEAAPRECPHEWEEVFLDGRALGSKCIDCGLLQSEVQDRCDHFFVKVSSGEMCVACRKVRRPR